MFLTKSLFEWTFSTGSIKKPTSVTLGHSLFRAEQSWITLWTFSLLFHSAKERVNIWKWFFRWPFTSSTVCCCENFWKRQPSFSKLSKTFCLLLTICSVLKFCRFPTKSNLLPLKRRRNCKSIWKYFFVRSMINFSNHSSILMALFSLSKELLKCLKKCSWKVFTHLFGFIYFIQNLVYFCAHYPEQAHKNNMLKDLGLWCSILLVAKFKLTKKNNNMHWEGFQGVTEVQQMVAKQTLKHWPLSV